MKKMFLFMLFCAHVLNGMEPESSDDRPSHMEALSPEIKVMIIKALNVYDNNLSLDQNLENILNNIKTLSQINWQFNAIMYDYYHNNSNGGFKLLVHMIAKKFNLQSCEIAKKFKTPAAEKYSVLCENLKIKIKEGNVTAVKELLDQGADIDGFPALPAVMASVRTPSLAMVQLLLAYGANPLAKTPRGVNALDMLNSMHRRALEYDKIKLLLSNAIKQWYQR